MVRRIRMAVVSVAIVLAVLALPAAAAAQAAPAVTLESFVGAWEGAAQTPNGDVTLKWAFKVEGGRLVGLIESSMGPIPVASAAIAEDKLLVTIDFQGTPGTLACKLQGSRIDGIWEVGGNSGSFWLARGGAGQAATNGSAVTGTWAGEVQIAGQVVPFSLVLRSDGDALAGEVASAEGKSPLVSASWKDGTLQIAFTYSAGEPVTMTAQLQDGKLVGTVDYNKGEAAGTFSAVKKQ